MQELEADSRAETLQGKRKRSGRYNTTGNPVTVAYRRWPNEAILVGQSRKHVTFDELTQTQFLMGFIKNVNDTMDGLTRQYMLLELFELLKLTDATSWPVARGAFISAMHAIEDGELAWSNQTALLQRRMTHTHSTMFTNQKQPHQKSKEGQNDRRLICKFFRSGNCRETREIHTDLATGICYTHDINNRQK